MRAIRSRLFAKDTPAGKNSRRAFLSSLRGAGVASLAASFVELAPNARSVGATVGEEGSQNRAQESFRVRQRAALEELRTLASPQTANGDEMRYPNFIGSYSKGLPHNSFGEVDVKAYRTFLAGVHRRTADGFEDVPLGGNVKLVNPMAGVAFDLEGTDSHQLAIPPAPPLASQSRADDMVEAYWLALCRDVNFSDYATNPVAQGAAKEISSLASFAGPRSGGTVNALSLFRGFTAEDAIGPYVSQFLLKPFGYGQYLIDGKITTCLPNLDYLTTQAEWLQCRSGQGPFATNHAASAPIYIRNGRDLGAFVYTDQTFEAFYNAAIWLFGRDAPPNPGNPYLRLTKQAGFATFGAPHFMALLAEVSSRALKAAWHGKWFVHRTLRPEDFGGLVHMTKTGQAQYPLHQDVLNSQAAAEVFAKYGTYFQPQAYSEGCPQHPSYAQGHASIAGACATILKAAVDGFVPFNTLGNGVMEEASSDGSSLVYYAGADASRVTVNGEINKLASNIGLARNFAGVHWRTDYSEGLRLGEAVALSILRDQRHVCCGEDFAGFTITKFDGQTIII